MCIFSTFPPTSPAHVECSESARAAADPGLCPLEHLGPHGEARLDKLAQPRHQHRQVPCIISTYLQIYIYCSRIYNGCIRRHSFMSASGPSSLAANISD